jgi:hypothetical protein
VGELLAFDGEISIIVWLVMLAFIWVYMDLYGFIWIYMGSYGFLWVYGLYGFIWIYMGLYGFIWVYMMFMKSTIIFVGESPCSRQRACLRWNPSV